ncbi:MAG TPA: hypothetical protein VKB75_09465 [Jatrophihabitans sp.]|nr:hypothetical protein [Jatrophihabitans sp.]
MGEQQSPGNEKMRLDRDDEDHQFVDQSKIDFDPDDGLYSGTAVDGNSEIPGPHLDQDSGEVGDASEAGDAGAGQASPE